MRTLDHLLYAWLAEADEQRFERAFHTYFLAAFPAVLRHLAHLSRWNSQQLEDIAQEALLQFFDRVGRGRRLAAKTTADALARIQPLALGALHEGQVARWTRAVSGFRAAALAFDARASLDGEYQGRQETICALAEQARRLRSEGYRLLHAVDLAIRTDCRDSSHPGVNAGDQQVRECGLRLIAEVAAAAPAAVAAERGLPGLGQFILTIQTLIEAIPRLRPPTNGFLFEIAANKYLDESRRLGRVKRGGTGQPICPPRGDSPANPLELLTIDADTDDPSDDLHTKDSPLVSNFDSTFASCNGATIDPAQRCENEDFFEQFCASLHEPLENAMRQYDAARLSGRALADSARRKVESLTGKLSRTMSVLSLLGSGYSQEQTAEQLGLSRNQVKYIVETVQAAYASFANRSLRPSSSSLTWKDARDC